jgi:coatomer subunit beta'
VTGSDDFQLRVYNYNTSEKITSFEAHPDYIRAIVVHPTQPFVLTASDDMTIKLWDWEKGWKCVQVFEGHSHYVMGLAINPKDTNTFASACLDRTVKIWNLGSGTPNFTLEAHETKGVNYVDYYPQSDKPYILTTSDDRTVKIWDYTSKALIATLEGHSSNVSFACYHPELPVIISGSEDGTIKIWHANTYRLEQTLSYGLERAWCVSYQRGRQGIAMGFDDGAVVVKMGREEPAVSMDGSGKVIWARHSEILTTVIKGGDKTLKDGEAITLPSKDLGSTELYPQTLLHSPNGRSVAVCGDGEYIIYTALALRNQAFGAALDFAWASKENDKDYAIRESQYSVKIFRNFKPKGGDGTVNIGFTAEGLSGGNLLGVKGQGGIGFFDWETGKLVRRIEVEPKSVFWSESGELVCLACEETFYVLRYSREQYVAALQAGTLDEDGAEEAFEVVCEINERYVLILLGIDFTNVANTIIASELVNGLATASSTPMLPTASTTLLVIKSTPSLISTNLHTCSATCPEMDASTSATKTLPLLRSPFLLVSLSTRPWFSAVTSMQPTRCCPTSPRTRRTRSLASSKAKDTRTKHLRSLPTPSTDLNSPSALVNSKSPCSSPVKPTSSTSGRLSAMLLSPRGTLR